MIGEKQNSPWLTCATGLAFGVVLGGSLTLAFAPALPVAVGVIATTTIIWGFIGHLAEEYQKKNLKNDYSASPATSTRQFSGGRAIEEREGREGARGKPTFSTLSPIMTSGSFSQGTSRRKLEFASDEVSDQVGDLEDDTQVCVKRRLFGSPDPVENSDDSKIIVYKDQYDLERTIHNAAPGELFPSSPQSSPPPMERQRRSAPTSPSATPIYVSAPPTSITADLVIFSPLNRDSLATNEINPPYCLDTPGLDLKSTLRIKAIKANAIDRRGECGEDPLSSMRLAGEQGCSKLVMAEWKKIDERLLDRPPLRSYAATFYGYTRQANGL